MYPLKLGHEAILKIKAGGIADGGSWIEVKAIQDLSATLERGETDVTSRESGGLETMQPSLKRFSCEFDMLDDPDADGWQEIRDAFLDGTILGVRIEQSSEPDAWWLQLDCAVFNYSPDQALAERQKIAVTLKATRSETPFTWSGNA